MRKHNELATWSEQRPERDASDRDACAARYSSHLPASPSHNISDEDLNAMMVAHIRRFDEDLPRTETLMAVANIGYRMALRDYNINPKADT